MLKFHTTSQSIGFTLVFLHVPLILQEPHPCKGVVRKSEASRSSRTEQPQRNIVLLSNYCRHSTSSKLCHAQIGSCDQYEGFDAVRGNTWRVARMPWTERRIARAQFSCSNSAFIDDINQRRTRNSINNWWHACSFDLSVTTSLAIWILNSAKNPMD